jgi:hypothetical protein
VAKADPGNRIMLRPESGDFGIAGAKLRVAGDTVFDSPGVFRMARRDQTKQRQ